MRIVFRLIVGMLVYLPFAGLFVSAQAQQARPADAAVDGQLWKRLSGWTVAVDRGLNNACFIVSQARGPLVRVGYDDGGGDFHLVLMHDAWSSLDPGQDYAMTLQLEERQYPGTVKVTVRPDGRRLLTREFTADEGRQFLQAFQRGKRLTVIHQGRPLANLSLVATRAAGEELKRCQTAMDKQRPATVTVPVPPPAAVPVPAPTAAPTATPPVASAASASLWKRIGDWQVRIDRTVGCEAYSLAAGPKLHLGYTERRELGVALTHDAWKSLKEGNDYPVTFQIEERSRALEMTAWRSSRGRMGLRQIFADEAVGQQLLEDLRRGGTLSAIYEGRPLASFALADASAVVEELRRCQASMPTLAVGSAALDQDPFRKP